MVFQLQDKGELDVDQIKIQTVASHYQSSSIPELKRENDLIQFEYQFKQNGKYALHLFINNEIALSYNLEVK